MPGLSPCASKAFMWRPGGARGVQFPHDIHIAFPVLDMQFLLIFRFHASNGL
jgi:hypothetical protein